jgi:crotonobetainyl-CoA:carnitine CoA-transferase CaiB-like acyl-CoA transferase
VALLAATDCCFEPLLEPDEVAAQPQVIYRQLIQPARGEALPTDLRLPIISDQKIPRQRLPLCELPFEAVAAVWQLE